QIGTAHTFSQPGVRSYASERFRFSNFRQHPFFDLPVQVGCYDDHRVFKRSSVNVYQSDFKSELSKRMGNPIAHGTGSDNGNVLHVSLLTSGANLIKNAHPPNGGMGAHHQT